MSDARLGRPVLKGQLGWMNWVQQGGLPQTSGSGPPPEGRRTCLLDLPHAGPLLAQLSRSAYVRNLVHSAYS
jgi:hypothetical protein